MPSPEDAWEAARARSREDVRAAFAPRRAECPSCGATVEADGRRCPACGASLVQTRAKRRPTLRGTAVALAAVAVLAVVLTVGIGALRDDASSERARAEARQRALVAAERRRLIALGRPRFAQGPRPPRPVRTAAARAGAASGHDEAATRDYRARLVGVGERAITRDARARTPDDPPRGTACRVTPEGPRRDAQERDAGVTRNRYSCIAYEYEIDLPELEGRRRTGVFGVPYWLLADYRTGRLTFCRMTPRGGEGVRTLATAVVDPACRDPFGRRG